MTKHRPTSAELLSFPSAAILPEPLVPANVDLRDFPYMPYGSGALVWFRISRPVKRFRSGEPA